MHVKRAPKECCLPHCTVRVRAYGRCESHYLALTHRPAEYVRLRAMTREEREVEFERTKHPPIPHFEYQGDEESLARQYGIETQHMVNVKK
jgi:hypothetical protein